jgi:hypothetical protein
MRRRYIMFTHIFESGRLSDEFAPILVVTLIVAALVLSAISKLFSDDRA